MEILNIGPFELIIFLVIAFLLLGPKEMVLTAYKIGESIRKFVRSPIWREIYRSAQDIRELPKRMMDETGLQQELDAIKKDTKMATDEVNASIKEAVKAAEVPEAQHLRIDGRTTDATVPAAVPASVSTTQTKPAMPAVFDGPPVPGLAKIPAATPETTLPQPQVTETPANAEIAEAAAQEEMPVQEAAPETGLVEVVDTPVSQEQGLASVSVESEPAPKPARKRTVRKTTPAVETPSEEPAVTASPEAAVETPAPARKRASRKKVEIVDDVPAEAAPNGAQPAVLSTTVTEPIIPAELLVPTQPVDAPVEVALEETPKPARKRTTRKKAEEPAETSAAAPVETTISAQSNWNPAWEPTSQTPANGAEHEEPPAPTKHPRRPRTAKPKANGTEE